MTHATAFRRSPPGVRDPRPGCPGTLHLVARVYDPSALDLAGARAVFRCALCGALIGLAGDELVAFARRCRRRP